MGDPSDILPPSEIEAIERLLTIRATMSADEFVDYVSAIRHSAKALLRHLRALTAPGDGEALGRELGEAIDATMGASALGAEDIMQKAAVALYLRGALSRDGEIAALREEVARLVASRDEAEAAQNAEHALAEAGRATIARLTAERDHASLEGARDERARCIAAIKEREHEEWMTGAPDLARRRAGLVRIGVEVLEAMPEIVVPDLDDDPVQSTPPAGGEIARLTAELAEEQDAHRVASQALYDRTAELAIVRELEAEALAMSDRWKAASERHEAELAEARRERDEAISQRDTAHGEEAAWREACEAESPAQMRGVVAAHRREVATARDEGAREEREACAKVQAQLEAWRDWKEALNRVHRVPVGNDGEREERDAEEREAWEALCAVDPSARGGR